MYQITQTSDNPDTLDSRPLSIQPCSPIEDCMIWLGWLPWRRLIANFQTRI